jgi:hypothetical protein
MKKKNINPLPTYEVRGGARRRGSSGLKVTRIT